MAYLTEHLSSLRQEITDLRNLNVLYLQRSEHSPGERTASDVRGSRLLQIKHELAKMGNHPDDSAERWGTSRRPDSAA